MSATITRRSLLAAACVGLAGRAGAAPAELPDNPVLLVGGSRGSAAGRWADVIDLPLGRAMQVGHKLGREMSGGPDGVTAANRFLANVVPDGGTALLVGGGAPLAWLVGDTRVRFDVGRWMPLWASTTPALVVCRQELEPGRPIRAGVPSFMGPDLASVLALELLGHPVTPVGTGPGAAAYNLELDAVCLLGAEWQARRAAYLERGWRPAFSLGAVSAEGATSRDPLAPDLPTAEELFARSGRALDPERLQAFRAVSAAATAAALLVLPFQTPATVAAWWRQGCATLAEAAPVQAMARQMAARPLTTGETTALLRRMAVEGSTMIALRRWLAERWGFQPA